MLAEDGVGPSTSGGAGAGGEGGERGGGEGGDFAVDPNLDPELALVGNVAQSDPCRNSNLMSALICLAGFTNVTRGGTGPASCCTAERGRLSNRRCSQRCFNSSSSGHPAKFRDCGYFATAGSLCFCCYRTRCCSRTQQRCRLCHDRWTDRCSARLDYRQG